jgi:hypothetical protein
MRRLLAILLIALAAPLSARDSLGVYDSWAAFRDASPVRCYAIAKAQGSQSVPAYMTVSNWPARKVRGAVHFVLSREVAGTARLAVGGQRFTLVTKGRNAWASSPREDAAIIAALRSAARLSLSASGTKGGVFTDRYTLAGAATAMDAATVGCANRS